jgi:hypothetical protein
MAAVPSPSRIRNEHERAPALRMNPVGGYRLPATRRMDTVAATVPSEEGLRFESLVIDLAAGFINVDAGRVDLVIEDCLRRIVEALDLDRSTLFQRSGEPDDRTAPVRRLRKLDRRPADAGVHDGR